MASTLAPPRITAAARMRRLSGKQPGARVHIVENNGPNADQRVRNPGKHERG